MRTFLGLLVMSLGLCVGAAEKMVLEAESGQLAARAEVVTQASFKGKRGVALKAGVSDDTQTTDAAPDLVIRVEAPKAGRYTIRTHAAVDAAGRAQMEKAKSKHESMFMKIAVGEGRPTRRVVFVPWSKPESYWEKTGKFDLVAGPQDVQLWLPPGIRLDLVEVAPYTPPKVPEKVAAYQPPVVPPSSHPRVWVNSESLPKVRANLTRGENAAMWKKVQAAAAKPFAFEVTSGTAVEHNAALETAAVDKAFVHLMTGDAAKGREAIALVQKYLAAVEFNNLLDITREIGRAMYAGARVYDWCYPLMTPQERESIRRDMMRLADDMEIGWPPFLQGVVNGHGAEAQLHCHLLAMAIAIYNEDPIPYRLCAYRVLEELVPMRNFEYQSPRHNQGIGYGIYRFGWDMHAAWLMYRMSGRKVFDPNIEDVSKYWLYMRLPNEFSFPDGDGNADGRRVNLGVLSLLTSAYANDPLMKRDFVRQGGLRNDPIMVLLLNDPDLKPADDLSSLPLTIDFGSILGGMVARTGWNTGKNSDDVVAFMTGGGYHFSNHQQADAGSFQLYYRGIQVADLGQYVFYGTPYDNGFNKRSVAHSMMLAYDPKEKFPGNRLNDGGARFVSPSPSSPEVVLKDPRYKNGTVLSADFGPSPEKPAYSYFSVDLTSAYSNKIKRYVRSFCFLNLEDEHTPAALLVLDNMETSSPEIKKYWQVNTLNAPRETSTGLKLTSSEGGRAGYVDVQMLLPTPEERQVEVKSGKESTNVFGTQLTPPNPTGLQAKGHRVMVSPVEARAKDVFLTALVVSEGETTGTAGAARLVETPEAFMVSLADRVVVMSKTGSLLKERMEVTVERDGNTQLVLTGLEPGAWVMRSGDGVSQQEITVQREKNSASLVVAKGTYVVERAVVD